MGGVGRGERGGGREWKKCECLHLKDVNVHIVAILLKERLSTPPPPVPLPPISLGALTLSIV